MALLNDCDGLNALEDLTECSQFRRRQSIAFELKPDKKSRKAIKMLKDLLSDPEVESVAVCVFFGGDGESTTISIDPVRKKTMKDEVIL